MNYLSQYRCQSRSDQLKNENSPPAEREPDEVPQVPPRGAGGEAAPEEPAGDRHRGGHPEFCQTEMHH